MPTRVTSNLGRFRLASFAINPNPYLQSVSRQCDSTQSRNTWPSPQGPLHIATWCRGIMLRTSIILSRLSLGQPNAPPLSFSRGSPSRISQAHFGVRRPTLPPIPRLYGVIKSRPRRRSVINAVADATPNEAFSSSMVLAMPSEFVECEDSRHREKVLVIKFRTIGAAVGATELHSCLNLALWAKHIPSNATGDPGLRP